MTMVAARQLNEGDYIIHEGEAFQVRSLRRNLSMGPEAERISIEISRFDGFTTWRRLNLQWHEAVELFDHEAGGLRDG